MFYSDFDSPMIWTWCELDTVEMSAHCLHLFTLSSVNAVDNGTNTPILASCKAVCITPLVYLIIMFIYACSLSHERGKAVTTIGHP